MQSPEWATEPKFRPGNAKSETVATSGMFRSAFKSARCLVPADGFYDWLKGSSPRQPYFFHRRHDELFAFAGIWSERKDGKTCAILTKEPNDFVRPIHDRMPVILNEDDYDQWLDEMNLDPARWQKRLKDAMREAQALHV